MRIVSLVPSWTETLIEAGLDVVGRTRFCIHPADQIKAIPVVGGTKEIDWEKVRVLQPDMILLDREENPKKLAEESPFPWVDTHVTDLVSAGAELRKLAEVFGSSALASWADRMDRLLTGPVSLPVEKPPAFVEKWGEWSGRDPVVYVIWKDPWMAVGEKTYIGSVLKFLGFRLAKLPPGNYPEVPEDLLRNQVCLFSSEPFPFLKKPAIAKSVAARGASVDGESFSWFGIRGLRFLESVTKGSEHR